MSNYPSKNSHMMRNHVWMHPARQTYLQSNQCQYQGSNKRPVIFHLCHHYMKEEVNHQQVRTRHRLKHQNEMGRSMWIRFTRLNKGRGPCMWKEGHNH